MEISNYENEHAIFSFDIRDPFIVLILLDNGKGTVTCKTCNETYRPDQLKPIKIGRGKSPFEITDQSKGGILNNLFERKRIKRIGTVGGRGYECPRGHELISVVIWRT